MAEKKSLTTREVAEKLGTDPRTLRRFLRARDKKVGTGHGTSSSPATSPGEEPAISRLTNDIDADQRIELGRIEAMLAEMAGRRR